MKSLRDDSCPICRAPTRELLTLDCAPKAPLPEAVNFGWCADCDFIHAQRLDAEAYRAFYRSALNDTGHVSDADTQDNLHRMQAELLSQYVGAEFCGDCLDYGSGEGQLLGRLARSLPQARFFGTDLRNSLRAQSAPLFVADLDSTEQLFDLIILSHVAEHFVDLGDVSKVIRHLKPNGTLYIEVPDPLCYQDHPRREFMYYFDRLHVNHFSPRSMERWLRHHGLGIERDGTHQFAYRDGLYPARFYFARPQTNSAAPTGESSSLDRAYDSYRQAEILRARTQREQIVALARDTKILVYGRGDNFYRAKSPGGPLDGVPIEAILDRNAPTCAPVDGVPVLLPLDGLARYPSAIVLITVSAGADVIESELKHAAPDRVIVKV